MQVIMTHNSMLQRNSAYFSPEELPHPLFRKQIRCPSSPTLTHTHPISVSSHSIGGANKHIIYFLTYIYGDGIGHPRPHSCWSNESLFLKQNLCNNFVSLIIIS